MALSRWCFTLLISSAIAAVGVIVPVRVHQQLWAHVRGVEEAMGRLFSASYWWDAARDLPALILTTFILALPFALVVSALRDARGQKPGVVYYSAAGTICALFWVIVFATIFGLWIAERFSLVDILERMFTLDLVFILLAGTLGGYCFARLRTVDFERARRRPSLSATGQD